MYSLAVQDFSPQNQWPFELRIHSEQKLPHNQINPKENSVNSSYEPDANIQKCFTIILPVA